MSDTPKTDAIASLYDRCKLGPTKIIGFARQLERELAAAQGERDEANQHRNILLAANYDHARLIEQQMKELDALREDRDRLDWLEGNAGDIPKYNSRSFVWFTNQNIRAAIDAARKEAKP